MKVYKFGGASVKDVNGFKNVANVLRATEFTKGVLVVSAIGKTTNALEAVVEAYCNQSEAYLEKINDIEYSHKSLVQELFLEDDSKIINQLNDLFQTLKAWIKINQNTDYNFVYDQLVCYGELLSSKILSAYLEKENVSNTWLDARRLIRTDATYRDAVVQWHRTKLEIQNQFTENKLYITQGFIGADASNNSVTLGREGSDYSAAILAYALQASSVTIWKDVPGVLNADPRYFHDTTLLEYLSYKEAIEMAFYGASVIHPKTLQPLQEKNIPLYVKSFLEPLKAGSKIGKDEVLLPQTAVFIVKKNQILLSVSSKDFSFIMEDNISDIFKKLHQLHIKVHAIQNSAISFTVCIEDKFNRFDELLEDLNYRFKVSYNQGVSLYTIRHFSPEDIEEFLNSHTVLLQQINRETVQLVTLDIN